MTFVVVAAASRPAAKIRHAERVVATSSLLSSAASSPTSSSSSSALTTQQALRRHHIGRRSENTTTTTTAPPPILRLPSSGRRHPDVSAAVSSSVAKSAFTSRSRISWIADRFHFPPQCGPTRSFSSSSSSSSSSRDVRLSGRRRFYERAGVELAPCPPWDHFDPEALVRLEGAQRTAAAASAAEEDVAASEGGGGASSGKGGGAEGMMVDSPISAGVDGTDSASGVALDRRPTREAMRSMLAPRSASLGLERVLHPDNARAGGGEVEAEDEEEEEGGGVAWYSVTLDSRPLRTPLGCPLTVPSPSLALAIASEWDAQYPHIRPAQMPLMTLTCTVLDQIAPNPAVTIDDVLRYLRNDTTCYRSDPVEGDRILARRQSDAWDGLHDWIEEKFGVRPATAVGEDEAIRISRGTKSKLDAGFRAGLPHPPELEGRLRDWMEGGTMDAWTLGAMGAVAAEAKSALVAAAVVAGASSSSRSSSSASHPPDMSPFSPSSSPSSSSSSSSVRLPYSSHTRDAVRACRVEEEFQIENWGLVEGGHDYDRLNCSVGVHAAAVLVSCVSHDAAS